MNFTVVIPARYASQRLPAKPLLDIAGKSMIQRVYEQVLGAGAERVLIATDHPEIEACAQSFGAEVVMTREDHASGTDRLAEVVEKLGLDDDEIVVNVQGDEPLIPPAVIRQVANNLILHPEAQVATVSEPIHDAALYQNPNAVKVVSDCKGLALYFSRANIPFARDADEQGIAALIEQRNIQKHIGIYAYKAGLLRTFVTWPVATLEKIEKLEQLRVLANGERIHVQEAVEAVPGGIDTQDDLDHIRRILAES